MVDIDRLREYGRYRCRKKETAESEPLTKNKEKEKEMSSLNETTEEVSTTPIQSQIELILDEIISGNPKATFL